MTDLRLEHHAHRIAKMKAQIIIIEQIQIADAHDNARLCRLEGRLARAADYMRLAFDLRTDVEALQRSINEYEAALTRDECRHSPKAPKGSRSEGFTAERATLTGQT